MNTQKVKEHKANIAPYLAKNGIYNHTDFYKSTTLDGLAGHFGLGWPQRITMNPDISWVKVSDHLFSSVARHMRAHNAACIEAAKRRLESKLIGLVSLACVTMIAPYQA